MYTSCNRALLLTSGNSRKIHSWSLCLKEMADDAQLMPNVQQHSGATLSPSVLLKQHYTVHALFMVNTCAGRSIFT